MSRWQDPGDYGTHLILDSSVNRTCPYSTEGRREIFWSTKYYSNIRLPFLRLLTSWKCDCVVLSLNYITQSRVVKRNSPSMEQELFKFPADRFFWCQRSGPQSRFGTCPRLTNEVGTALKGYLRPSLRSWVRHTIITTTNFRICYTTRYFNHQTCLELPIWIAIIWISPLQPLYANKKNRIFRRLRVNSRCLARPSNIALVWLIPR